MKSTCCNAPIINDIADEGTGCMICSECNKPCDMERAIPAKESGFKLIKGDEVNCILNAALRSLTNEQMVVLKDSLIKRTPAKESVQPDVIKT